MDCRNWVSQIETSQHAQCVSVHINNVDSATFIKVSIMVLIFGHGRGDKPVPGTTQHLLLLACITDGAQSTCMHAWV